MSKYVPTRRISYKVAVALAEAVRGHETTKFINLAASEVRLEVRNFNLYEFELRRRAFAPSRIINSEPWVSSTIASYRLKSIPSPTIIEFNVALYGLSYAYTAISGYILVCVASSRTEDDCPLLSAI